MMQWMSSMNEKVIVYQSLERRSAIGLSTLWAASVCCVLCMVKVEVTVRKQVIP